MGGKLGYVPKGASRPLGRDKERIDTLNNGTCHNGDAVLHGNKGVFRFKVCLPMTKRANANGWFIGLICDALCPCLTLFCFNSWSTYLALDSNKDSRVRVNFNITMMDLKCEYAVIDVVSVLGTEQNATTHVTKWKVDGGGVRRQYQGRNKQQNDILLKDDAVTETLEELHENGEDAISFDPTTLQYARNEYEYVFVDFYASWCSHCRDLAPTWYVPGACLPNNHKVAHLCCRETLAEVMDATAADVVMKTMEGMDGQGEHGWTYDDFEHAKKSEKPVVVGKVDCVTHHQLCRDQNIRAYPTLRMFIDGEASGDYQGHRTVVEMADWLALQEEAHKVDLEESEKTVALAAEAARRRLEVSSEEKEWAEKLRKHRHKQKANWDDNEHPGCQLAGYIMVDRVPGNFHIMARSSHHDLVPHMTNVSHLINSLSVGEPAVSRMVQTGNVDIPSSVNDKLFPMSGNVYVTKELHESYHHYLKVITTDVEGLESVARRKLKAYQILQNSQLAYYRNDMVPGKPNAFISRIG